MIKVGLTGNIGAGKSTVARVFVCLGVPVYNADQEAKRFLHDQDIVSQLKSLWGDDIVTNNMVDRQKLASIVFAQPAKLKQLNSLIHPRVKEDLLKWMASKHNHVYVIQEAAILFESGFYQEFDRIITVVCPEDLAIKRIMDRDGSGENEIRQRMNNQWSQQEKIIRSDYVVTNDGHSLLIPQVLNIHNLLSKTERTEG
jgi:dephospho-CoA kinase